MTGLTDMWPSFQAGEPVPEGPLRLCAEQALECAQACTICADACLAAPGSPQLVRTAELAVICADLAIVATRVLSGSATADGRLARPVLRAFGEVLDLCHEEFRDQELAACQICADICRDTRQVCRLLA